MSADNLIAYFPFKKKNNEIVWRVCEVTLSSLAIDIFECVVTGKFEEYEGRNAENAALAAARRIERKIQICEYGISKIMDEKVLTIPIIEEYCNQDYKEGWKERELAHYAKNRIKVNLYQ
jgi:hypothetical protein